MGLTNRVMTFRVFCFSKERDIWGLQVTYADEKLHPQPRNDVVTHYAKIRLIIPLIGPHYPSERTIFVICTKPLTGRERGDLMLIRYFSQGKQIRIDTY